MSLNINNPDYFLCDRFHCRMLKEACIERQEAKKYIPSSRIEKYQFPECENCEQGLGIRKEVRGKQISDG